MTHAKTRSVKRPATKRHATGPALPGADVRGSTTGRPVMALFDLLGRRWVLRILWELRSGPATFRALRAAMDDVSPSVLNARLADLRAAALVEHGEGGYAMTPLGHELATSLRPVVDWSERWARRLKRR